MLLRQAEAVGLPVHEVTIPWTCSNEEYETAMSAVVAAARDQAPVVVGSGKRLFSDGTVPAGLKLIDSSVSTTGMVIATYEPAGEIVTESFELD